MAFSGVLHAIARDNFFVIPIRGDLIKIRKLPDNFFVIKTDVEKGVIRAGSTYGYSMSYVPEDVEQWPWELEQKGGSNDI